MNDYERKFERIELKFHQNSWKRKENKNQYPTCVGHKIFHSYVRIYFGVDNGNNSSNNFIYKSFEFDGKST